ncbi:MAG: 50S ribosomal protein L18 [Eubacteriales bacterium]|nr:50S ribosomal protein L18 [Clostridiales bacterium]MDY5836233.1 50S ribosomal protein L18 [Eubacteriales bacterium]
MIKKISRNVIRKRKQERVRKKVSGTAERPRLSVFRSNAHIYAQIINDETHTTLAFASSLEPEYKGKSGANTEAAKQVGQSIAERALKAGIEEVVFDRSGYIYHGRVAALADAAREAGLKF